MKAKKGDVPLMGGYIGCKPSCRPAFLFQYQLLLKIKVKRAKSHSFLQTGKIQNRPFKICHTNKYGANFKSFLSFQIPPAEPRALPLPFSQPHLHQPRLARHVRIFLGGWDGVKGSVQPE
jgi:hypothetical protein